MATPTDEHDPATGLDAARAKIRRLLDGLDGAFVEREPQARLTLLALLARQHVLLLGPPGTAKSQLARAVCRAFEGARYFEYLLTRFSHPDELFGPVSIPGLKDEDYRRLTEGFLPAAHVAFVDEIFKANSAILNSLLALVNERVFHHGRHRDPVPLIGLIGASNEAPDPEGGLGALYDRFLVRLEVPPIHDDEGFLRVATGALERFDPPLPDRLTVADCRAVVAAAEAVDAPPTIRDAFLAIRHDLREAGVDASDRRWRWAVALTRVAAVTSGRASLGPVDLALLAHCFGDPDDAGGAVALSVQRALERLARPPAHARVARAWATLGDRDGGNFQAAVADRVARVDAVAASVEAVEADLDERRDALIDEASRCPWVHDVPARLVAGFIGARRDLGRYRRAVDLYRRQLAEIDLYGELVPRAREAQLRSIGHGVIGAADEDAPPLWVSRPGAPPEHWVPVTREGILRAEQRAVLAGAVQREAVAQRVAEGRPVAGEVDWHTAVRHVALDNEALAQLTGTEPGTVAATMIGDDAAARAALEALARWLRGVGLRRLPEPPPLEG